MASASLAAFALARSRSRVRRIATSGLLVAAFFPPIVFLFPLYELVRMAGLVNHPWGLILPYTALNLPFSIWLLIGYFNQIPYELEEAAAVDSSVMRASRPSLGSFFPYPSQPWQRLEF